jgi:hypothetical protein
MNCHRWEHPEQHVTYVEIVPDSELVRRYECEPTPPAQGRMANGGQGQA